MISVGRVVLWTEATHVRNQIAIAISMLAPAMCQKKLDIARTTPERVRVWKTPAKKMNAKVARRIGVEYCEIARMPLISHTKKSTAAIVPKAEAILRATTVSPRGRPISISFLPSQCFVHQGQGSDENPPPLGELVSSLVAVRDESDSEEALQMVRDRGAFERGRALQV